MADSIRTITLDIEGMTCASCVRRVERALSKVEGVETASVNLAAETALVSLGQPVAVDDLIGAVSRAGYTASESRPPADREQARSLQARRTLAALIFGAILAIPTVVLAMGMDIADITIGTHEQSGWILLALATPVQAVLGWRFYRGAAISLRHLNPNMDVLVALGTSVAFAFSAWTVFTAQHR